MVLMEIGCDGVNWMHISESVAGSYEHGYEPSSPIGGGEFIDC
jgi:hypothetical protein